MTRSEVGDQKSEVRGPTTLNFCTLNHETQTFWNGLNQAQRWNVLNLLNREISDVIE